MSDNTKIEWTDATWNPITGCSVVSPGCTNCYAMKLAGTRLRNHPSRAGLTQGTKAGPIWNGKVRFNEQWLQQPMDWKRPRRVFVCAHGDLFHESVPFDWIDRVFAVIALSPQHTFQVLTKRADRMREYMTEDDGFGRWGYIDGRARQIYERRMGRPFPSGKILVGPLPNVWLGVSAEDQRRADERIPLLLRTPAAVRWLSCEPLLGPIDLLSIPRGGTPLNGAPPQVGAFAQWQRQPMRAKLRDGIDWLVAGGESGKSARPMHPDWVRSLRDQCAAAGTAFFFKQWGEWQVASVANGHHDGNMARNSARWVFPDGVTQKPSCIREGWAGGEPYAMAPVGKKISGCQLDGREHNDYPETT